jgi:large subunit ribosomal protein L18
MAKNTQQEKRLRLKRKIRSKISGTESTPRLSVFKSNMHVYAQIIDDVAAKTLCSTSDLTLDKKGTYRERATAVGQQIAKLATGLGITSVVFDRNGYKYTGHVAALADAARDAGLKF